MKCLYRDNGKWEAMAGCRINETISEAISIASKEGQISFEFNGVTITVAGDSDPNLIYRDWDRALHGYIEKNVGPWPKPLLTLEEYANDERIKKENEVQRAKAQTEYDRKAEIKRKTTEGRLSAAPPIALKDEPGWQQWKKINSEDGYSKAVVDYAEVWARLMQLEMANGKPLAEIADSCSSEADVDGITGFMYGCAVQGLSQFWAHGEDLRKWHNKSYGVEASEGVVNPAILTIN